MICNNQLKRLFFAIKHNHIMVSLFLLLLTTSYIVPATARITSQHKQKREVGERSVFSNIARELLSHLVISTKQKRDVEDGSMIGDMAREGATLGLMAYMAFEQEDKCLERLICDVTERLQMMSNSMGLLVTAADFVIPKESNMRELLMVAKEAANGQACYYYKCGALPYHSYDDENENY